MISDSIMKYIEPVKHTYGSSVYVFPTFTQRDIDEEIDTAKTLGLHIGKRYRYKTSQVTFTIKRYETDVKYIKKFQKDPAILLCSRGDDATSEVPFSINEFLGVHMEEVPNV